MKSSTGIYSEPSTAAISPELQMLRLASGHIAAQAVYVFAVLGIADILSGGTRSANALETLTDTNGPALHRLLRFLTTIDVVAEHEDNVYSLTRLGRTLCNRSLPVVRDNTLLVAAPCYWTSIGGLLRNIQTGETACEHAYSTNYFGYLATHPAEASSFNAAMNSASHLALTGILAAYDFSGSRRIVDVGGGKGALLQAILKANQTIHGVLFDSQDVIDAAPVDPEIATRLSKVAGSFFDSIPADADTYILRRVLHDWSDEKATEILHGCRRAMHSGSKLLVVELAAPSPGESRNDWAGLDLLMMVLMGGRERTESELRQLLSNGNFMTTRIAATKSPYWIVEAKPLEPQA